MANRRQDRDDENAMPKRESPFESLDQDEKDTSPYENDDIDEDFEEDDYEQMTDEEDDRSPSGFRTFLSSVQGKVLCIAVLLLVIILLGVCVWRFAILKPSEANGPVGTPSDLPSNAPDQGATVVFEPSVTQAPAEPQPPVIFGPNSGTDVDDDIVAPTVTDDLDALGDGDEGDEEDVIGVISPIGEPVTQPPEVTATPQVTAPPEVTATPEVTLPIILTNTPTPSPTAPPTPTPSPTALPTPTPTPSPTPVVDIGSGKTNRDAKLRGSMSAQGSVKQVVKKGEAVTVHEAVMDTQDKLWYAVTVNDNNIDGWMRDYVVDLDGELSGPITHATEEVLAGDNTEAPALPEGVIATGKTNRDANVRKIMNGKVLIQLRKGRPVSILDVKQDKAGDTWYQVRTENGTVGFVRHYLIKLDAGSVLPGMEQTTAKPETTVEKTASPTPGPTASPTPEPTMIPTVPPTGSVQPAVTPGGTGEAEGAPASTGSGGDTQKDDADPAERQAIGEATTNRDANIREKPTSKGKVVRQLSKGTQLRILGMVQSEGATWYEVTTTSGKTYGYARDYVLSVTQIDPAVQAVPYAQ